MSVTTTLDNTDYWTFPLLYKVLWDKGALEYKPHCKYNHSFVIYPVYHSRIMSHLQRALNKTFMETMNECHQCYRTVIVIEAKWKWDMMKNSGHQNNRSEALHIHSDRPCSSVTTSAWVLGLNLGLLFPSCVSWDKSLLPEPQLPYLITAETVCINSSHWV